MRKICKSAPAGARTHARHQLGSSGAPDAGEGGGEVVGDDEERLIRGTLLPAIKHLLKTMHLSFAPSSMPKNKVEPAGSVKVSIPPPEEEEECTT